MRLLPAADGSLLAAAMAGGPEGGKAAPHLPHEGVVVAAMVQASAVVLALRASRRPALSRFAAGRTVRAGAAAGPAGTRRSLCLSEDTIGRQVALASWPAAYRPRIGGPNRVLLTCRNIDAASIARRQLRTLEMIRVDTLRAVLVSMDPGGGDWIS